MSTIRQYREEKRQTAREESRLIERSPAGFYSTHTGPSKLMPLVYLDGPQVMMMGSASIEPVTRSAARSLIISNYSSSDGPGLGILFTDRDALRSFRKLAGNNTEPPGPDNLYYGPVTAFDILSKVQFSETLKILTDVLNHRWWLPAGKVKHSIDSWIGAPSVFGATLPAKLRSLEESVRFNTEYEAWTPNKQFQGLEKVEYSLMESCAYTGVSSGFSKLRDMQGHSAKSTDIARTSPKVQYELSLNGELTRALFVGYFPGDKTYELDVVGVTKLSQDKMVDCLSRAGLSMGKRHKVVGVTVEGANPLVSVRGNPGGKHVTPEPGDVMYLAETPFGSRFVKIENRRWISKEPYAGPSERAIPLDIMASGS